MINEAVTSSSFENKDVEDRVIGTMLCYPNVVEHGCTTLSPDVFSCPINRLAFRCIQELNTEGRGVDLFTVIHRIRGMKKKDPNVGYDIELVNRTHGVVSAALFESYVKIIKTLYVKRQLFEYTTKACSEMRNDSCDVYETMNGITRFIDSIEDSTMQGSDSVKEFSSVVEEAAEEMKRRVECFASGEIVGIRTGSYELDRRILGWQDSKFIVIGGRTANGKTSFSLNAVRTAAAHGTPVVFFSMEMPRVEIAQKLIAAAGNIDYSHIQSGNMSPDEIKQYISTAEAIGKLPITVIDAALTIDDIYRIAKSLNRRKRCAMVVIDYLQKVPSAERNTREQEVAYISRRCKELANDIHVPVIALAQVNREVDKREDTMPHLYDLRESGSIEQDADLVLFVDRRIERVGAAESIEQHISIAKNRGGGLDTIILYTNPAMTQYSDKPILDYSPF